MEYKGYVAVVSGDYKTEDDGISTPFEAVKCNLFVTESTFGLPVYRWKPQQEIFDEMKAWILGNQQQGKTSLFTGYSLGKAQRLMKLLEGVGKLYIHPSIARLNEAMEKSGILLPYATEWNTSVDKKELQGQVVIVPPAALTPEMVKKIPRAAVAICSGWMQVRGHRRWQAADAGFAISDHADWDGLLRSVHATGAEKVMVTHGYAEPFARYLNETGIAAEVVKTRFGEGEEE
jgi:putative mRNA 3-end processing factor